MGSVLLCRHATHTATRAAVKRLPAWDADDDAVARFRREADALARLDHPHIVPLVGGLDAWGRADDGALWLAMGYVEGPTLEQRLDHGPLTATEARDVLLPLTAALAYAHARGVYHRDLKPSNLVLGPDGVQVIDFGIALHADLTRMTRTGSLAGTLAYLPPEVMQEDGPEPSAAAGDVYALGLVAYEAMTAQRAFASTRSSPKARDMEVLRAKLRARAFDPGPAWPDPWREVVARMTEPDPSRRLVDLDRVCG
ncbi:MAG TPA: serine/threonine-protein kinase, partial [Myxococcota bacterium]|nr:serine/threonine-protein kinase [Myxococcota bacterium]